MKKLLFYCCCWLLHFPLTAQYEPPPALQNLLSNNLPYHEIVRISDDYYRNELLQAKDSLEKSFIERQLKLFERWKMYTRARLEPDGRPGNAIARVTEAHAAMEANPMPAPQSLHGNWRPMGPTRYNKLAGHTPGMGRINCVAFDPNNPDLIYAGSANGGLWRREPNGNWTPLTDHLPSASVSGLVVNYQNGNDIWILTGDGDSGGNQGMRSDGVFESHDGGASWIASGKFPGPSRFAYNAYKLVQDPQNPAVFFACTTQGLFRSSDYCKSWVQVGNEYKYKVKINEKEVERIAWNVYSDLVFKPGDHNTVYTTTMTGINRFRKSTDNGKTWKEIQNNGRIDSSKRLVIGVTAAQPNWVYLLSGPATGVGIYNGIFGSVTSGDWFILNGNTPNILGGDINGQNNKDQSGYDLALAIHPQNGTYLITGGIDIWTSQNGGTNMTKRTHWDMAKLNYAGNSYGYVHADIHNLTYNGNRLYACTDGGLAVSYDHGVSWTPLWNGLNILQSYKIAGIEADENHWMVGTQDNGTMYRNNSGMVVQHVGGGDGRGVIINPDNVNSIWFTATTSYYYSLDGGVTSTYVVIPGDTSKSWPLLTHNVDNVLEQLIGKPEGIFKYYPSLLVFSNRGAGGNSALTNCPSSNTRFFAAQDSALYRSDDGGDSWVWLNAKPGFPTRNTNITDIAVSPSNSGFVVVTFGGYDPEKKVFLSSNGGESWTNITGNLLNTGALSVAVGPNGSIYIGNEMGVFFRRTTGEPWIPFLTGLPLCPVNDLLINMRTGLLRAATFGRGVWETALYSPCENDVTLAGDAKGNYYVESAASINSTQLVSGGTGTDIIYRSAGSITLKEGMAVEHVKEGTTFKAYLGPCGNAIKLLETTNPEGTEAPMPEELNTYKYPPLKKEAYWRIKDDYLEYYLPDYTQISVQQMHESGQFVSLIPKQLHAKGLYRIKVTNKNQGQIEFRVNDNIIKPATNQLF
jgi:hypothetical protein